LDAVGILPIVPAYDKQKFAQPPGSLTTFPAVFFLLERTVSLEDTGLNHFSAIFRTDPWFYF
jgi:hypothetical protein